MKLDTKLLKDYTFKVNTSQLKLCRKPATFQNY